MEMNGIMKVINKKYGISFHIIPLHAQSVFNHECFITLFYFFSIYSEKNHWNEI